MRFFGWMLMISVAYSFLHASSRMLGTVSLPSFSFSGVEVS